MNEPKSTAFKVCLGDHCAVPLKIGLKGLKLLKWAHSHNSPVIILMKTVEIIGSSTASKAVIGH